MSLHSDNILLIKVTTKKSTGFRCFSFAQKEERMEIKINKEIRSYKETVYFSLTARHLICSLLAVGTDGVAISHRTGFETAARPVWYGGE